MRTVLQRVSHASCSVEGQITGKIDAGLLVMLGIENEDSSEEIKWLSQKIVNMRIFADENGLMNKSLLETSGDILLISQFTLFAQTKKGNRPSFVNAAKPEKSFPMYVEMSEHLEKLLGKPVAQGVFGADMRIDLQNTGPVTIVMDSRDRNRF